MEIRSSFVAFLRFRDCSRHQKDSKKLQNEPLDVTKVADTAENETFEVP
jgi:hypothetical protein